MSQGSSDEKFDDIIRQCSAFAEKYSKARITDGADKGSERRKACERAFDLFDEDQDGVLKGYELKVFYCMNFDEDPKRAFCDLFLTGNAEVRATV